MKMKIKCEKCSENGLNNQNYSEIEINSQGTYEVKCSEGHVTLLFSSEPLFDTLFDFGGYALMDGYNREAVVNFATALERFYEYCIQVMCFQLNVDTKEFNSTWKLMKKSERQIGAFFMLYLGIFKEKPVVIETEKIGKLNVVNFRNEVVHNGFIPKHQDTLKYGELVYNYIQTLYYKITRSCYEGTIKAIGKKQKEYYESNSVNHVHSFQVNSNISFLNIGRYKNGEYPNFYDRFELFKEYRDFLNGNKV